MADLSGAQANDRSLHQARGGALLWQTGASSRREGRPDREQRTKEAVLSLGKGASQRPTAPIAIRPKVGISLKAYAHVRGYMAYFLNLFTPETWRSFREAGASISRFRERQRHIASERVKQGDILLCYLTRLSRWCGVLQVTSGANDDRSPILDDSDPFTVRVGVEPIAILEPELSIPIYEEEVWKTLSITNQYERGHRYWTGFFRSSLNQFDDGDGGFLVELLKEQQGNQKSYPLTEKDKRQLASRRRVRTLDREVEIEVPDGEDEDGSLETTSGFSTAPDSRESIRMQAQVAQIGAEMGFHIWVPRNDKTRVLEHIPVGMHERFMDVLPLNYDDTTLRTVEQIDVLWLKGRSMSRAFEIEHTTAIYSGLLRMADLLALQPNMNIRLHIVAPDDKRARVLREIRRPVFCPA